LSLSIESIKIQNDTINVQFPADMLTETQLL